LNKFLTFSALVAGVMASGHSIANAGFPEIEIVEPIVRESTGGCRNPVADAWEQKGGLDLSGFIENVHDESTSVGSPENDQDDLPAYLREDS